MRLGSRIGLDGSQAELSVKKKLVTYFSFLVFLFSVYSVYVEYKIVSGGIFTQGTVITKTCINLPLLSHFLCAPIAAFKTQSGKYVIYEFSPEQSLSVLSGVKVGKKIDLYYDKEDPQNVVLDDFFDRWFPYLLGILSEVVLFLNSKFRQKLLEGGKKK